MRGVFTMSKVRQEIEARCELAMMGKVQKCESHEVEFVFHYIKSALGHEDDYNDIDVLEDRIKRFTDTNEVKYVTCYMVYNMPCICFLLESTSQDKEERYPAPFEEGYGTLYKCAFCYVFNLESDECCSEFGDVFFKKLSDGYYHIA